MSANWRLPVSQTVTRAWADALLSQEDNHVREFDTPFSYGKAMDCSRALSYRAIQAEKTDPMDGASLAIAGMGSLLHKDIQDANGGTPEVVSCLGDLLHGYADIDNPDADEVVEIKTVGAFKFDMATGIVRGKGGYRKTGKGPGLGHICQGGFNAKALGRANVRIVYVSREAVSVTKAERMGLGSLDRFTAEWLIPREVWEPIVEREIFRMEQIREGASYGLLADRTRPDDETGEGENVNPDKHPLCRYCPFYHRCRMDGPGVVSVPKEEVA